jgi:hypothetical protein
MGGAIVPLLNTLSWRDAHLKRGKNLILLLLFSEYRHSFPVSSWAFAVTKFDEVFPEYQPRQVSVLNRRLENHPHHHYHQDFHYKLNTNSFTHRNAYIRVGVSEILHSVFNLRFLDTVFCINIFQFSLIIATLKLILANYSRYLHLEHSMPRNRTCINFQRIIFLFDGTCSCVIQNKLKRIQSLRQCPLGRPWRVLLSAWSFNTGRHSILHIREHKHVADVGWRLLEYIYYKGCRARTCCGGNIEYKFQH